MSFRRVCSENNFFEPEMTIYHGSNCGDEIRRCRPPCCCPPCCPPPCCPPPCPPACTCVCELQLKHVLAQLITLYPDKQFEFTLEDGGVVTGIPEAIVTVENQGLIKMKRNSQAAFVEYVNICKIAFFKICSAQYNSNITYLLVTVPLTSCGCAQSIFATVKLSDNIQFNAAGKNTGNNPVMINQYGIVVQTNYTDLIFVSTCQVESFKLYDPV